MAAGPSLWRATRSLESASASLASSRDTIQHQGLAEKGSSNLGGNRSPSTSTRDNYALRPNVEQKSGTTLRGGSSSFAVLLNIPESARFSRCRRHSHGPREQPLAIQGPSKPTTHPAPSEFGAEPPALVNLGTIILAADPNRGGGSLCVERWAGGQLVGAHPSAPTHGLSAAPVR